MKNIDLTKLTKVELINEIINLTNKCNECIRLRGYLNTHKVLSANTLRTKSREFLEKQFEQAWGWLYEEVRANYSVLPINIDKIDFGMVGTFDLDSERGHQQLFLMSLLSYIGSNGGLRTKINEILEDIHDKNLTRVRIGYCGFRHVE